MIDRSSAATAAAVMTMSLSLACGEPEWRESREPVRAADYGGAVQPDINIQYDAPSRTIYDAPPDLALRGDSLAQMGTPADSIAQTGAAADSVVETDTPGGSVRAAAQQPSRPDTTTAPRR